MSLARPSALAVLRLLRGLSPLLLLLLRPLAVRGDCGLPAAVPNAQPDLRNLTSFPDGSEVTYRCDENFVKIPGKPDSVVCAGSKWSDIEEFCNRSCDVPPRFLFASLKKTYSNQNYFPVGSAVEYECRLGYRRDPTQSGSITCLESLEWSKPAEFCQKKSCPNPGDLVNGHINITTDILFGSTIYFSCDIGYLLVGSSSSYCETTGNTVSWSDRFPLCVAIQCPEPPRIANGTILRESNTYVYNQFVTYKCSQGFTLVGEPNIYCIVKDGGGEWTSAPQCKGKSTHPKVPPTVQKPTTVNVPTTQTPSTTQKSTKAMTSDTTKIIYGHMCITLTVLLVIWQFR